MTSLSETWGSLEKEPFKGTPGLIRRRLLPLSPHDLFAGIEKPSGLRLLVLRAPREDVEHVSLLPSTAGLEVRRSLLPEDPPNTLSVSVVLIEPRFADVFGTLAQDMVDHLSTVPTWRSGVEAFILRLQQWLAFLKKHGPSGLSPKNELGLFGELWVLRKVFLPTVTPTRAVAGWTGPLGTAQDFQLSVVGIEVKSTPIRQGERALHIASEHQLDDSDLRLLFLVHLFLEMSLGAGETLPDIISDIRSQLGPFSEAKAAFEIRLRHAGYLDAHENIYAAHAFTLRETASYRISTGFPRIVPATLMKGLQDVSYCILVDECRAYRVEIEEATNAIAGRA